MKKRFYPSIIDFYWTFGFLKFLNIMTLTVALPRERSRRLPSRENVKLKMSSDLKSVSLTGAAVRKLFSVRWRKMVFKGCRKREESDYECLYEDRKNDLSLAMLTRITRRGYLIESLSFSSEAI
jgi:hypothetical protein